MTTHPYRLIAEEKRWLGPPRQIEISRHTTMSGATNTALNHTRAGRKLYVVRIADGVRYLVASSGKP